MIDSDEESLEESLEDFIPVCMFKVADAKEKNKTNAKYNKHSYNSVMI